MTPSLLALSQRAVPDDAETTPPPTSRILIECLRLSKLCTSSLAPVCRGRRVSEGLCKRLRFRLNSTMSNVLFLVVDEICSRLFGHRPFIQGEIGYLVKEFETKRNDQEVAQIDQIFSRLNDINGKQIDHLDKLSNSSHYERVSTVADNTIKLCQQLLATEIEQRRLRQEKLADKRQLLLTEFEAFVAEMKTKANDIDTSFEAKERQLIQEYNELETKLRLNLA